MTLKLIDPDFCRFTEDEKKALTQDAEQRSQYDYLISYLEDRGRYTLESERRLENGDMEAVYAHVAGGLAAFTISGGVVIGVEFTEGLAGWAGESGDVGPTEEMQQVLLSVMTPGNSETWALEMIDERFYPLFYAERRQQSDTTRYYLLYPKCVLEIVGDEKGRIKSYRLLGVDEAVGILAA